MPPDKEYFRIIREICDKYGVHLIFDEIQTSVGRTGKMWAADYYDVVPDFMTIGKGIGGGVPLGICAMRDDIQLPSDEEQEIISTFAGSALMCAAASAVLDIVVEEDLPAKANRIGSIVKPRLDEMQEKHPLIGEVRGAGLFYGVELVRDKITKEKATDEAVSVCNKCREKGMIIIISGKAGIGNVLNVKPPMTIPEELAARGLEILDEVLTEVEKERGYI
jgi:4-aminobutyrate aminotransferase-like enzyme